uniref:Uncharacterized protein n=1 Tax=Melopsittacus undulatus TaxID=13146 RepID=A0A8V5FYF3_MELUD
LQAPSSLALNTARDGGGKDVSHCSVLFPFLPRELKLRNYDPEDEELKKRKMPPAKPASVEDKVKDQLEAAKPEPIIDEVDLANLAPRKPDWDLKRDVAKKLEKLEKRTQRAIAELISALWCQRDGVREGRHLFQRDYTMLAGSLVSCCWAREALVAFPKGSGKLLVPLASPRLHACLACMARGMTCGLRGSCPSPCSFPSTASLSLNHCCFALAGERLKGQEEELASAVGSAKQEGSDSD